MTYNEFWQPLCSIYDAGEAKAIARMVMEVGYGLTMTDILCDGVDRLPHSALEALRQRLAEGEPVQYVLGVAEFGGRTFSVGPGVLIPRPETFELCQWIISEQQRGDMLDIGTGSGCIACTLAAELPEARLTAWDISETALDVAAENAGRTDVGVTLVRQDALRPPADRETWDVIVSNPPYICRSEQSLMAPNVVSHEPHTALFVPDDDALRFYDAIARYAVGALRPGGCLYFEINPLYASELETLLASYGLTAIETRSDQYGKKRMTKACKPNERRPNSKPTRS